MVFYGLYSWKESVLMGSYSFDYGFFYDFMVFNN